MTIEDVWQALEREATPHGGVVRRRVLPDARGDFFLAVHKPQNEPLLLVQLNAVAADPPDQLPQGRGIESRMTDTASGSQLELRLSDPAARDIFATLVADILRVAETAATEQEIPPAIFGRLAKWQRFLRRVGPDGLPREERRGLYGELWFMKTHLIPDIGAGASVRSWAGPTGAPQDFQLGTGAVEVKATGMRQQQRLRIVSELQLDDSAVDWLVLFHVSVDVRDGSESTLPSLVASVRDDLTGDPTASLLFDERLLDVGYLDSDDHLYSHESYSIRETNAFRVGPGFPRLVEASLPHGVGDLHYSITVSECDPFRIPIPELVDLLRETVGA